MFVKTPKDILEKIDILKIELCREIIEIYPDECSNHRLTVEILQGWDISVLIDIYKNGVENKINTPFVDEEINQLFGSFDF